MNVALSFPGCHRRGGVERIVFECARYMSGRGHRVDVYTNEWETDSTVSINYRSVPMRRSPWFLRGKSYFTNCSRILDPSRYDIVNTHGCVCPFGGVQWVQSVHRAWLERGRQLRGPWSRAGWKQRLNPLHPILLDLETKHFAGRRYKKIIATTPQVRADLHRLYGVPEGDVVIVPNGFSPTEFSPQRSAERRDQMRRQIGLTPDHIALLFVGNELERKGFRTLLSAVKILNRPELRIMVVGRPPVRSVMQMASQFGLASQVIACGLAEDVAAYHAACDLFVLPTQYEAFCLAILEALGSGMPVITSNVPGARDAIVPGVNGALIDDPLDGPQLAAVLEPLLNGDLRALFAARASESVAEYQWPKVLGRYEGVLEQNRIP